MDTPPRQPQARQAQAPESYATFWEPVAVSTPPAPAADSHSADAGDADDAYLEFVNVTEGAPRHARA